MSEIVKVGEIVNLRKIRKQKQKKDKEMQAAHNRISFGRSHIERKQDEAKEMQRLHRLEAHRLSPSDHES